MLFSYRKIGLLPPACSQIVELTPNEKGQAALFRPLRFNEKPLFFTPDPALSSAVYERSALRLANVEMADKDKSFTLPKVYTFLEMYSAGKVEHLNIQQRWSQSDASTSLAAPVGVDSNGNIFMLDIHEKAHGPHGLIAGMTGSGKSEWIMSYILSLAICYNPEDLAFILIDYKGGGMAQAFAKLPHTAGIITNLDGNMIRRSLMSIDSELKRRQRIFSLVSSQIGTSTIDIYKYQQLYHQGEVKESIPHLLIIADEFAELKDQEPEFMDDLISAARIGRSLGVHLILATQKPSGVVNDQIWSNTRFRICLKVQDRSDSQEMLRRPEALNSSK